MNLKDKLNLVVKKEKASPEIFHHYLYSYFTDNPDQMKNREVLAIAKYFDSWKTYLPLYQSKEFKQGLTIEITCEMMDATDQAFDVHWRKALYHNHDFFELVYVFQGTCPTTIQDEKVVLKSGQMCLLNLQAVHMIEIPDEECVVFNILVGREFFSEQLMGMFSKGDFLSSFFLNSMIQHPFEQNHLIFTLDEEVSFYMHHLILEFVEQKASFSFTMKNDFTSILIWMNRKIMDRKNQICLSQKEMFIEEVLAYISSHYNRVSLDLLADHFGYSARTMNRYLKKYTEMGFKEIVRIFQLNNACWYLSNSSERIDDIAEKTGFTDRSYFDRVFKQTYQISPSAFRLHLQQNAGLSS